MSYKVRKFESEDKGTHYGIFINDLMIHYEYSRGRARDIVEELGQGKILAEIIIPDIERVEQRKFKKILDEERKKTSELTLELYKIKKQIRSKIAVKPIKVESVFIKEPSSVVSNIDKDKTRQFMLRYNMDELEARELSALISEVKGKDFEYSKELSRYIIKNQLKRKYPNISGVVKMEKSGEQWDFSGGFPKRIYGIVCSELDLSDQGTTAKAVGFTSFKEMEDLF